MRHPAYHLKINKDADRLIMVEAMRRLFRAFDLDESATTYWSFGGPFLEDMRLVHGAFPSMRLASIERDANTVKRQDYHRFINKSRLDIIKEDSNSFINRYSPTGADIIWLDYLTFSKAEVKEVMALLPRLQEGSLIKITFSAQWLTEFPPISAEKEWAQIYSRFYDKFSLGDPSKLTEGDFTDSHDFAKLLNRELMILMRGCFKMLNRHFQPLVSNVYKDETQMISIMGVIAPNPMPDKTVKVGENDCNQEVIKYFSDWDLVTLDGSNVVVVDLVPVSHKERLALQAHLPVTSPDEKNCLYECLPYLLGNNIDDHKRRLDRYASMSSYYGYFGKVSL